MADPAPGRNLVGRSGDGCGHEQAGQRPALVLSIEDGKSKNIPAHIRVDPPEGGLKSPSVLLCDQLRAVSKDRLGKAP